MKYAIQENCSNAAIKILNKIYRERDKGETWYFMKYFFKSQQDKEID